MRRLAIAAFVLASCALAVTAQEAASPPIRPSGNWFTRMFSSSDKPDAKKPAEKKTEPVNPVESAAARRAREDIVWKRRMDAILKLRELAILGSDSVLLRKADELEERANDVYFQRTAGLTAQAEIPAAKRKDRPGGNER
jgi:hypothetical protein